jgi:hypothetical protein
MVIATCLLPKFRSFRIPLIGGNLKDGTISIFLRFLCEIASLRPSRLRCNSGGQVGATLAMTIEDFKTSSRDTDEDPLFATKAPSHEGKDLNSFSFCGALCLRVLVAERRPRL